MKKEILIFLFTLIAGAAAAQTTYRDSLERFLKNYVKEHQVVPEVDKKYFRFFPVDEQYRVVADFTPATDTAWFEIPTSSGKNKKYRAYGRLHFSINGQQLELTVYQSHFLMQYNQYWNYLFLPFKDATNGKETYETGRYLDLKTTDIKNNRLTLDFNKAYNPYCAYVATGYSCPVPPKENHLPVAIKAGEQKFAKPHR
ncbi:hypothetical protein A8C56_13905 [Niabella ginsenosidivorans]|uniref:DUF1684 domain-containing protein n=1 Tax=Niabella ginsenosidivorans TaxID=1176587 RepID=A0A1A9I2N3_9BACT|nr:DUF1684 domain-containing protein [Niabella ginsenosidivorans]ANH81918.1 hypothetical protein A8C56_13905 [Niabella ginsenosidivorans]